MTTRGRPPKKNKLVPLVVMVPREVKSYLQKSAEVQQMTLSDKVREVLNYYYETR